MKPSEFELQDLAAYVSELCVHARKTESVEPLYRAAITLADVIPTGRGSISYASFNAELHAECKNLDADFATLVYPRRHRERSDDSWWIRSLVGWYPTRWLQQYVQEDMLSRAAALKPMDFTFENNTLYIRKSRYRNEEWLVLANPLDVQQRTRAGNS